ncbi:hypothetical protein HDU98_000982 [Podochytrium sp. JEL0797]|nr:hypothetical protein HDU98_000982 [Podochytrium sp. JEL0797]
MNKLANSGNIAFPGIIHTNNNEAPPEWSYRMVGALDKLERNETFAAKFFVLTDRGALHMFRIAPPPHAHALPSTAMFVKTCSGFYDESRAAWILRVIGNSLGNDGKQHRRVWTLRAKDAKDLRTWLDKMNEQVLHPHSPVESSPNPSLQSDSEEYHHHPPPLMRARVRKNSSASSVSLQSTSSTADTAFDWDHSTLPSVPEKNPGFIPPELVHPRPVHTFSPIVKSFNVPPPPCSPPEYIQRKAFSPSRVVTEPINPNHPQTPLDMIQEAEEPPTSTPETATKLDEPRDFHQPLPFVLPPRKSSISVPKVVDPAFAGMRRVEEQEEVVRDSRDEVGRTLDVMEDLDSDTEVEEEDAPKKLFGLLKK